jgi:hypothetical protein
VFDRDRTPECRIDTADDRAKDWVHGRRDGPREMVRLIWRDQWP